MTSSPPEPPPAPGPSGRRDAAARGGQRRPRRWRRVAAVLLVLVVGGSLLLYLARNRVLAPFVLARVQPTLERALGGPIHVERFAGNWWSSLRLEGVSFRRRTETGPLLLVEDADLAARYDLVGLLRGGLAGLRAVELRADALVLTPTSPPPDLGGDDAGTDDAPGEPFELPAELPALELRLWRFGLLFDAERARGTDAVERLGTATDGEASALAATGALTARDVALTAEGDDVHLSADALDLGDLVPRTPSGPLDARFAWNGADVRFESLRYADTLRAGPGSVDLRDVGLGAVAWDLPLALAGDGDAARSALVTRGGWDPRDADAPLALDVEAEDFELRPLSAVLPAGVPTLAGRVDLTASWRADPDALLRSTARLELDGSAVRVAGRPATDVRGTARLEGAALVVPTLDLVQGANELHAEDVRVPLVGPDPGTVLAAAEGELRAVLGDVPALVALGRADSDEERPEPPTHALELAATLAGNALRLTAGSAVAEGGSLRLERGVLTLPPAGAAPDGAPWWQRARLDVDLVADVRDLAQAGVLLGRDDLGGSLEGELRLEGTPLAPVGRVDLRARDLLVAGLEVGDAYVDATLAQGRVEVARLEARAPTWLVEGTGGFRYGAGAGAFGTAEAVTLEASLPALERLGALVGLGDLAGAATARLELDGPLTAADGAFAVAFADARLGPRRFAALGARGRLVGGDVHVEALNGRLEGLAFQLAGVVRPADPRWSALSGELTELGLERGDAGLALSAPAGFALGPEGVRVDELVLAGSAGRLALAGSARGALAEPSGARVEVVLGEPVEASGERVPPPRDGLQIEALLGPLLPPVVSAATAGGKASLDWRAPSEDSAARLDFDADLRAGGLRLGDDPTPVDLDLRGRLVDERLTLQELTLDAEGVGSLQLTGGAPLALGRARALADGPLEFHLDAETVDLADWPDALAQAVFGEQVVVRGGLVADGDLEGTWAGVTGRVEVHGEGLDLRDRATDRALEPVDLDLVLDVGEARTTLTGDVRLAEFARVVVDGTLGAGLDADALARGELEPLLRAPLAGSLSLDVPELAWLGGRVPGVRRLSGTAHADVRVDGTLGAPAPDGSARLEGVELRLSSAFPALQAVDARMRFTGDTVELEGVDGRLGGATFRLSGSVVGLTSDAGARLDLALSGEDLLLYRDVATRVRANTDVQVTGALDAIEVKGSVALTEGRYGEPIRLLQGLSGEASAPSASQGLDLSLAREGVLADLRFDLELRSEEPFEVENNLVNGGLRPRLRVGGTGEVPLLDGSVFLEPTLVSLPSGTLRIEAGRLEFDPRDPFVPKLELSGGMRLKGYDVRVVVSGDYDDPSIRLSSTPPLPNQDLLVLFLTGQLPEGSAGERGRGAAESVAVYLAQDYVTRWLSGTGEPDDDSFLQRLDLSIGSDITRSGALTTEVTYLLTDRAVGAGHERYLVGERDVYDKINFGYGLRFRFQ